MGRCLFSLLSTFFEVKRHEWHSSCLSNQLEKKLDKLSVNSWNACILLAKCLYNFGQLPVYPRLQPQFIQPLLQKLSSYTTTRNRLGKEATESPRNLQNQLNLREKNNHQTSFLDEQETLRVSSRTPDKSVWWASVMENHIRRPQLEEKIPRAFETIWEVDDPAKNSMVFFFSIREVLKKKMATYTGSMITFLPYKNKRTWKIKLEGGGRESFSIIMIYKCGYQMTVQFRHYLSSRERFKILTTQSSKWG